MATPWSAQVRAFAQEFGVGQGFLNHLRSSQGLSVAWAFGARGECALDRSQRVGQLIASCADRHDRDIRVLLHRWLEDKHAHQADTAIIHELEIPRPSARVDIALINGRISGYEIKSAADTLSRLDDQAPSFSSVFERMTLVVAARHIPKAIDVIPEWWEIIETDGFDFRTRRAGRANPNLNLSNLLHILTRKELLALQSDLRVEKRDYSARKESIVAAILDMKKPRATKGILRKLLKQRTTRRPS